MGYFEFASLGAIYLTFAVVLGLLLYEARARLDRALLLLAVSFGALVFLPLHLGFPVVTWLRGPLRLLGAGLIAAYATRPDRLPARMWSATFLYQGLGVSMGTVSLWGIAHASRPAGPILGLLAALAAGMAWRKVRAATHRRFLRPRRTAPVRPDAGGAQALVFPLHLGRDEQVGPVREIVERPATGKGPGQRRVGGRSLAEGDHKRRPEKGVRQR